MGKHPVLVTILSALAVVIASCSKYFVEGRRAHEGVPSFSFSKEFDIAGLKTDFTALDVALILDGKRISTAKVQGNKLVLAYECRGDTVTRDIVVEVSRDGELLLRKTYDCITRVDILSLDLKSP